MREALFDLLEAVEAAIKAGDWKVDGACEPDLVIRRAKEALAQPEQGPVAWLTEKRYAELHSAQRTWIWLTYEEQEEIVANSYSIRDCVTKTAVKLKEKNT